MAKHVAALLGDHSFIFFKNIFSTHVDLSCLISKFLAKIEKGFYRQ